MTIKNQFIWVIHDVQKYRLVNTVTVSFNTDMRQMAEVSQQKSS